MKGIARALWNYPTIFAGALQAVNASLAAADVLPVWVALPLAAFVAAVNFAAVGPVGPDRFGFTRARRDKPVRR
ncbi:MAG TPA: hypothetical protein VFX35_01500 [Solirubrobacterales bacterium]|nr:hypothetical protein [Solirubrobacterales bacterium]